MGGRELWVQGSEKRRVSSQKQNQSPKVPTVAEVRTPAAPGARSEGPGSSHPASDPTRRLALLREGAEGSPAESKSALRSEAAPAAALLLLGTRAGGAGRSRGRSRPARRLSACSSEPSPRAAARGWQPAPAPRGALAPRLTGGAPQAG